MAKSRLFDTYTLKNKRIKGKSGAFAWCWRVLVFFLCLVVVGLVLINRYLGRYQWPVYLWELCFVKLGNCWYYFCGIFWYFDLQYLFHRQATVFDWYSNKLSFSLNAVFVFVLFDFVRFALFFCLIWRVSTHRKHERTRNTYL